MTDYLLSLAIMIPAVTGLALIYMKGVPAKGIRWLTLISSLVTFVVTLMIWANFDITNKDFQLTENYTWIQSLGVSYSLGIDGISLFLILLTGLIMPIAILGSWSGIKERVREFHIALMFLACGMIGVFAATDLILFYIFWEVMLIPMILLIGIWGSENRVGAAVKFFVYTMVGSLLMFLAIIYLYMHLSQHGITTFSLSTIYQGLKAYPLSATEQVVLFLAFALSFAIKVPLFPLHTWLPDAHTQAPTAGSVILAGVLLKMGTYGFLRFAIPFFPHAVEVFTPAICVLAVISIIFGALMCLVQEDFKKLIAYSSVSHLGFVILGIFALNERGVTGGIFQMLSHGISTGALFLLIGAIYERTHTRKIEKYGGIAKIVPKYSAVFFFVLLSSIGLPALNGFVGEFLILLGSFESNAVYAIFAATGMVLGALYMLILYQKVFYGKVTNEENKKITDLNMREWVYITPLLVLMVVMGMGSPWFTEFIEPSVESWLNDFGNSK